jgi:oligopeptide transport system substrate-binding protein
MRNAVLVLLTAAAAALLTGCGRPETVVAAGDRAQVLHRGIGYEVVDLDPQLVTSAAEQSVIAALFEGLVREDARDLHPVPGVAASWEISPDGLQYLFHLRPEARWSDGTAVTADDFVGSWRRMLTPSLAAENASLLYVLQGAESYHRGASTDFATVGVTALDPHTLRVTLEHPAAYFLSLLCHMAWMPVPLKTIAAHGRIDQRGNAWTKAGTLVGNGPFTLSSWQPDRAIVVKKSAAYWDAGRVRLQEIRFYPIDSVDAEEREFRAGQLHVTDALPVSRVDAYRRESPGLLRTDPYLATYFYRINTRRPFLSDARVRRALALAVDRRAIAEKLLRGGQAPAGAFTPPGMAGYAPGDLLPTDFAAARELLAAAGYPGGAGLPTFHLSLNNSENHRLVAEAVQQGWRRELGVQVELLNQENKTMLAARRTGDYELMRADWVADYPDPSTFLDVWRGNSGNNYTGWSNSDYDAWLFAADRTADAAERGRLWLKAERTLLDAAPIVPIYFYTHVFLLQPSVRGWYPNPLDHHPYQDVWLAPQ